MCKYLIDLSYDDIPLDCSLLLFQVMNKTLLCIKIIVCNKHLYKIYGLKDMYQTLKVVNVTHHTFLWKLREI